MFEPQVIIDLIADNVRKTRNPFGVPSSQLNTWWREAGGFTRRPGDALLFTGLMYQAIPYIEATTRYLDCGQPRRRSPHRGARGYPGWHRQSLLGQPQQPAQGQQPAQRQDPGRLRADYSYQLRQV